MQKWASQKRISYLPISKTLKYNLISQKHDKKKEPTRSITYRLPTSIIENLELEAREKNVTQNVLVKQILEKFVTWERFANKIGMIQVPKSLLLNVGKEMDGNQIIVLTKHMITTIRDAVLFMKGGYSLEKCIESFEDYLKATGIKSDHRIEGSVHHFIIQHELGMNWSLFTESLLKIIFETFRPKEPVRFQTTDSTVIASISLGSDFNEHSY